MAVVNVEFEFVCHPEAEAFVNELLHECTQALPLLKQLTEEFPKRTYAYVSDFLDHLLVTPAAVPQLNRLGFVEEAVEVEKGFTVLYHPTAIFPRMVVNQASKSNARCIGVAIAVEDAVSFALAHHLVPIITEGNTLSPYRRVLLARHEDLELWAVERRGFAGFVPKVVTAEYIANYLACRDLWANRQREFVDRRTGMEATVQLAKKAVELMGSADLAAWVCFSVEREHWEQRNWAGKVQKGLQDRLGLGWANHDHHTFRSSRDVFPLVIQLLETFGFYKRERFYAGAEAGWGAQVMEQPVCRFAVFADVDLAPEESQGDFTHNPLPERPTLGTVGLWCSLHGESALQAGLHHIAARVSEFSRAMETQNTAHNVRSLKPFSEMEYLRQTFTAGEKWRVAENTLAKLLQAGLIDKAQHDKFLADGAVASHLEYIQRGQGFKGFNQTKVSDIITRTDPRLS